MLSSKNTDFSSAKHNTDTSSWYLFKKEMPRVHICLQLPHYCMLQKFCETYLAPRSRFCAKIMLCLNLLDTDMIQLSGTCYISCWYSTYARLCRYKIEAIWISGQCFIIQMKTLSTSFICQGCCRCRFAKLNLFPWKTNTWVCWEDVGEGPQLE